MSSGVFSKASPLEGFYNLFLYLYFDVSDFFSTQLITHERKKKYVGTIIANRKYLTGNDRFFPLKKKPNHKGFHIDLY